MKFSTIAVQFILIGALASCHGVLNIRSQLAHWSFDGSLDEVSADILPPAIVMAGIKTVHEPWDHDFSGEINAGYYSVTISDQFLQVPVTYVIVFAASTRVTHIFTVNHARMPVVTTIEGNAN